MASDNNLNLLDLQEAQRNHCKRRPKQPEVQPLRGVPEVKE